MSNIETNHLPLAVVHSSINLGYHLQIKYIILNMIELAMDLERI